MNSTMRALIKISEVVLAKRAQASPGQLEAVQAGKVTPQAPTPKINTVPPPATGRLQQIGAMTKIKTDKLKPV